MKLETLFEKFNLFADAPDAVEKMRELVLELAVTGKLVAHDERDDPASSLLASAQAERAKLVAARRIKARPTSPVEPDEQPFEVPPKWAWARLSDVGYELGQKIPDKRFTYIDVGGIDSDKGCISERVEQLEPSEAPSRARKLVTRGTVIYSTVRPYLRNIAIVDQDFDPEPIASTAFGILYPFASINNRYMFYWLRSGPFTAYVEQGMKGMAYPAINDEKFYTGYIPLPPLAEQKRIVAKVDELMALCDRLALQQEERETRHAALARASLARFVEEPTPANLDILFHKSYSIPPADLRKSILTLAVQGKLVPQDPNDEPAGELLGRIATSKSRLQTAGKIGKDKPVDPVDLDSLPFQIPESWRWAKLAEITELITKGSSPKWQGIAYGSESEGILFITSENVGNYRLRKLDDLKYVEKRFNENSVVTTNFDQVLEEIYARDGKRFVGMVTGRGQANAFFRAIPAGDRYLLKLHGNLDNAAERVLNKAEYDEAYGNDNNIHLGWPLPKLLKRLYMSYSFLFLGCSLSADRTILTFTRVAQEEGAENLPHHYAILPSPSDWEKRRAMDQRLAEAHITPLWYPDGEHDYVEQILQLLLE